MRLLSTILFLVIFPFTIYSQSFVWCPKMKKKSQENINLEGDVTIDFKDSRTYEAELDERCNVEDFITSFSSLIEQTNPELNITFLVDNQSFSDPQENQISIEIEIMKFDVTYGARNIWDANTQFLVRIYDYRKSNIIYERELIGHSNSWSYLGPKNGKNALNRSFKRAFDEFLLVLRDGMSNKLGNDDKINKTVSAEDNGSISKAERLRELKQLLDEEILTQEEFDKEKKKILDEK